LEQAVRKTKLTTYCPFCFGPTSTANDPYGENVPKTGDLGICLFCGEVSVFSDKGRRLRKPNIGERKAIMSHEPAQALKASWQARHA
jgi:hypothetical protein